MMAGTREAVAMEERMWPEADVLWRGCLIFGPLAGRPPKSTTTLEDHSKKAQLLCLDFYFLKYGSPKAVCWNVEATPLPMTSLYICSQISHWTFITVIDQHDASEATCKTLNKLKYYKMH
ncbi:Hypothetical predicted protein [Podarcis lilfordi]|nr:Hypothetical predicted protein [Podarcis lilfordi]